MLRIGEQIKSLYAQATGMNMLAYSECVEAVAGVMDSARGIVVGEVHGSHAHARFVEVFLPAAAERGARHFYVEMFQQWVQPVIDKWQKDNDATDMIEYINRIGLSYTPRLWTHYWSILQTANDLGMKIICVEPAVISPTFPGQDMYLRNDAWAKCIAEQQDLLDAPYVLYCGRGHLTRAGCNKWEPIQSMLNIPAVFMKEGRAGLTCKPDNEGVYSLWVPKAADQLPIAGKKVALAASIPSNPRV